jgi:hypothetical protein
MYLEVTHNSLLQNTDQSPSYKLQNCKKVRISMMFKLLD